MGMERHLSGTHLSYGLFGRSAVIKFKTLRYYDQLGLLKRTNE
jgi:hypothetical protein